MDFESLKKIPHSLEAERALIGGIFYNQELFEEIKDIVTFEDFYKVEHSAIYEAMEKVYSDSKGIDAILIDEEIKKSNLKNKDEVLEVLSDILDEITSSYNLLEYANLIKEKAMLRRLGNVGAEITKLAYNDIRPAEDIIDVAESMVLNLSKKILKNSIVDSIYNGSATVATSPIPKITTGHNENSNPYEQNIEKAKELLAEAGYPNGFD